MIAKANTHDSGGRLAKYLVTGKKGERAELWELRGFASEDIVEAFRSVHVIAGGTKCQQPFFHVQVRNPETDRLNREQWQYTADRIERMLGLKDQPRAIAFHIDQKTGEEHIHIAWSRIDDQTLTAKALPFYKERLKKLSRELEMHFGLTLVPNERESAIKYGPTRAEDQQARRLGLDAHTLRETIRDCFERADCGRSFEAALAEQGMVLARGERRDYVVVDQAGGAHALGKRILGVTAAQTRERLADIPREQLPSVQEAKEFVREQNPTRQQEKAEPLWDRDRDDMAWQNAVIAAAIEKAREEDRQQHRQAQQAPDAKQEAHGTIQASEAGPLNGSPGHVVEGAGQEATNGRGPIEPPEHIKGAGAEIWKAYNHSQRAADFAAGLKEQGIGLAAVTKAEADQSHREAAFARQVGRFSPEYGEGETVAVSRTGRVFRLNTRTTGNDRAGIQAFLSTLDREELRGIEETKRILQANRHRDEEILEAPDQGPTRGGMVVHQSWALDFIRQRAEDDEHRRRQLDEGARIAGQTKGDAAAEQEFEPERYLTDENYRRDFRSREKQEKRAEVRTNREQQGPDRDERER